MHLVSLLEWIYLTEVRREPLELQIVRGNTDVALLRCLCTSISLGRHIIVERHEQHLRSSQRHALRLVVSHAHVERVSMTLQRYTFVIIIGPLTHLGAANHGIVETATNCQLISKLSVLVQLSLQLTHQLRLSRVR